MSLQCNRAMKQSIYRHETDQRQVKAQLISREGWVNRIIEGWTDKSLRRKRELIRPSFKLVSQARAAVINALANTRDI